MANLFSGVAISLFTVIAIGILAALVGILFENELKPIIRNWKMSKVPSTLEEAKRKFPNRFSILQVNKITGEIRILIGKTRFTGYTTHPEEFINSVVRPDRLYSMEQAVIILQERNNKEFVDLKKEIEKYKISQSWKETAEK